MTRRLLFVCLGNICRSPTAQGVFAARAHAAGRAAEFEIDSAGIGGWHVGSPPDPRAVAAAARRGIDLTSQRARQVRPADFERFDLILAMDGENLTSLENNRPAQTKATLARLGDYAPKGAPVDIPDPYYGGADGFEQVLDLLETASSGLLDRL